VSGIGRSAAALLVAVGLGGLGIVARDEPSTLEPTFTVLGAPTMPFVPTGSFVTSSWFCPGVPNAEEGTGGSVVVTNPADEPIDGRLTVYSSEPGVEAVSQPFDVEARSSRAVSLGEVQPAGAVLSAVVEIDGGGGFVEQEAVHPAGASVSPCANAASSRWYFAEGFTAGGSTEVLVLTNPYPEAAIVDIGFVTEQGVRDPSRLQGYPVPGRSVQVVELGARNEPVLAAQVVATRGRVVAARAQHYTGAGRAGHSVALGAPSLASQVFFADGEVGDGITERYSIFNPSEEEVVVDVVFLGVPVTDTFLNDVELTVPAGRVLTLDTADVAGLPAGRHGAVFSTFAGDSIVVERVITRPAGDAVATSVVMGSPSNLASTRWSAAIGTAIAIEDALVVLNVDAVDGTVTVSSLGPGGLVPVPGLDQVPLAAGAVLPLALTDPTSLGRPLVVESTQRIYVERRLPRGEPPLRGRSGSFMLAG